MNDVYKNLFEDSQNIASNEALSMVEYIKKEVGIELVKEALDSLANIKVLVLGDAILDEYTYCDQLGEAGKEPLIVYNLHRSETHTGGVFAVANHVAQFSNHVTLLTCVGDNDHLFIKNNLNPAIRKLIVHQKESKTLIKKRYIHNNRGSKLFEVYNTDGLELSEESEKEILKILNDIISEIDMIIVADFGHGLMTKNIIDFVSSCGKFLAVNTQLNGGNLGYNFITKYPRADFISLNDREIRLPLQEKKSDIKVAMLKLQQLLNSSFINITLGKQGLILLSHGEFFTSPAFSKRPIDTIGAGDAVLSIASLLSFKNKDPNIITLITSCMGAIAVGIVGNREPVYKSILEKFMSSLIKEV